MKTAVLRRVIDTATMLAALYGLLVWLYRGTADDDSQLLNLIDIRVYLAGGQTVITDASLNADPVLGPMYFTYPPFAALVFFPFSLFGEALGKAAWVLLTGCLAYIVIRVLIREIPGSSAVISSRAVFQASIFGLFAISPMLDTIILGQINILLMLLVVVDLSRIRHGQKSNWWTGALIGVAAGIKLTPVLFIFYLLWIRRWREAGVAVASIALTVLLGFTVLPTDSVNYWTKAVWTTDRIESADNPGNQSIMGLLTRLTEGEPSQLVWFLISSLVCIAAFLAGGLAFRRGRSAYGGLLVGLASCIASPWSWGHHWVWACGLLIVLFADAAVRSTELDARPGSWLALLLPAILLTLSFTLWPARWYNGKDPLVALHYNAHPQSVFSALYSLVGIVMIGWLLAYEVWLWRRTRRIEAASQPVGAAEGG